MHLTIEKANSIDPSAYTIRHEKSAHRDYWCIDLIGDRLIVLSDEHDRPIQFDTSSEALGFCKKHWPELHCLSVAAD